MVLANEVAKAVRDHWWVLVLRGLVGIAFGLAFLFYPKTSLLALLYLFGAFRKSLPQSP